MKTCFKAGYRVNYNVNLTFIQIFNVHENSLIIIIDENLYNIQTFFNIMSLIFKSRDDDE